MELDPELFSAHVMSGSKIFTADVLKIGDDLWIVSRWLETQDGQWRTPEVAIRANGLQRSEPGSFGADMFFRDSIPTDVLDGRPSQEEAAQFEVVRGPSDRFPLIPKRRVS